jgi:hypothetical protein
LSGECDEFPVTLTVGHHRLGRDLKLAVKGNCRHLRRLPFKQLGELGPIPGAMDFCVTDRGQYTGTEQRPPLPISPLAYIIEPLLANGLCADEVSEATVVIRQQLLAAALAPMIHPVTPRAKLQKWPLEV